MKYNSLLLVHPFHREGDAFTLTVDGNDLDTHLLVDADHLRGVFDEAIGQLWEVHQTTLLDTDIDKGAKVGDVVKVETHVGELEYKVLEIQRSN